MRLVSRGDSPLYGRMTQGKLLGKPKLVRGLTPLMQFMRIIIIYFKQIWYNILQFYQKHYHVPSYIVYPFCFETVSHCQTFHGEIREGGFSWTRLYLSHTPILPAVNPKLPDNPSQASSSQSQASRQSIPSLQQSIQASRQSIPSFQTIHPKLSSVMSGYFCSTSPTNTSSTDSCSSSSYSCSTSSGTSSNTSSNTSSSSSSSLPSFNNTFASHTPPSRWSSPQERLDWDRLVDNVFIDEIGKMTHQHKRSLDNKWKYRQTCVLSKLFIWAKHKLNIPQ